ncbi:winged helix-turn-helix domain-containing protein [Yokenella regensburgei]|uniref:winged helix-turn-helix domain-containing protein n=1 Tax=Yokenella regensburgei TaxID=158877 RepID=UPI001432F6A6|nr:winged helix-turn-helix domain-containing protein [Yokenella regensburgei]QIU88428.1 hypothetical protein HEC60_03155 [Yokenella regensburgei]
MCPTYLINNEVEFRTSNHTLINKNTPEQLTTLPVPASRCFMLLLENKDVVLHADFYKYVWGENAGEITPNNLYQNISLLRKALRNTIKNGNNWIITIPRKGFRIESELLVNTLCESEEITESPSSDKEINYKPEYSSISNGKFIEYFRRGYLILIPAIAFGFTSIVIDNFYFATRQITDQFFFIKGKEVARST